MPSDKNKIIQYAKSALEGVNLQTQDEYIADDETINGVSTGVADGLNFNKLSKQTSLMSSALAEFTIKQLQEEVSDTLTVDEVADKIYRSSVKIVKDIQNGVNIVDENSSFVSVNDITKTGIYWVYKKLNDQPFTDTVTAYSLFVAELRLNGTDSYVKVANTSVPNTFTSIVGGTYFVSVNTGQWQEITGVELGKVKVPTLDDTDVVSFLPFFTQNTDVLRKGTWSDVVKGIKGNHLFMSLNLKDSEYDLNSLLEGICVGQYIGGKLKNVPANYFYEGQQFIVYSFNVDDTTQYVRQIIYKDSIPFGSKCMFREKRSNFWSNWSASPLQITNNTINLSNNIVQLDKTKPEIGATDKVVLLDRNNVLTQRTIASVKELFGGKEVIGGGLTVIDDTSGITDFNECTKIGIYIIDKELKNSPDMSKFENKPHCTLITMDIQVEGERVLFQYISENGAYSIYPYIPNFVGKSFVRFRLNDVWEEWSNGNIFVNVGGQMILTDDFFKTYSITTKPTIYKNDTEHYCGYKLGYRQGYRTLTLVGSVLLGSVEGTENNTVFTFPIEIIKPDELCRHPQIYMPKDIIFNDIVAFNTFNFSLCDSTKQQNGNIPFNTTKATLLFNENNGEYPFKPNKLQIETKLLSITPAPVYDSLWLNYEYTMFLDERIYFPDSPVFNKLVIIPEGIVYDVTYTDKHKDGYVWVIEINKRRTEQDLDEINTSSAPFIMDEYGTLVTVDLICIDSCSTQEKLYFSKQVEFISENFRLGATVNDTNTVFTTIDESKLPYLYKGAEFKPILQTMNNTIKEDIFIDLNSTVENTLINDVYVNSYFFVIGGLMLPCVFACSIDTQDLIPIPKLNLKDIATENKVRNLTFITDKKVSTSTKYKWDLLYNENDVADNKWVYFKETDTYDVAYAYNEYNLATESLKANLISILVFAKYEEQEARRFPVRDVSTKRNSKTNYTTTFME